MGSSISKKTKLGILGLATATVSISVVYLAYPKKNSNKA